MQGVLATTGGRGPEQLRAAPACEGTPLLCSVAQIACLMTRVCSGWSRSPLHYNARVRGRLEADNLRAGPAMP